LYRPKETYKIKPINDLLDIESRLHNEFQNGAPILLLDPVDYDYWDWDSYLLLQHHGGATRLLDWSDGAMIALHFALGNPSDDVKANDAVVYVLSWSLLKAKIDQTTDAQSLPTLWREYVGRVREKEASDLAETDWEDAYLPKDEDDRKRFDIPKTPVILDFPRFTRRVAAQRSQFIVFGSDPDFLNNEFSGSNPNPTIRSIEIEGACRRDIRRELRDAGVSESVIFPDLDGLGRELKMRWLDQKAGDPEC
jgi:hypothetical protein